MVVNQTNLSTKLADVLTKAQIEGMLKANQLAVSAPIITNDETYSVMSGAVGMPLGKRAANYVTNTSDLYLTDIFGKIGIVQKAIGVDVITPSEYLDTTAKFKIWNDVGGEIGDGRFGDVVWESDDVTITSLDFVERELLHDTTHHDLEDNVYNFAAKFSYKFDISGLTLPAGNYLIGYENTGSNDIIHLNTGIESSINESLQYWGYTYGGDGPDANAYSEYYRLHAFYTAYEIEETILSQIKSNALNYRNNIIRSLKFT
jgi:hypothetical protein